MIFEDIDEVVEATKEILSVSDKSDAIKPKHYRMNIKGVDIEARDIMQAVMTPEEYDGFLYGNILNIYFEQKERTESRI